MSDPLPSTDYHGMEYPLEQLPAIWKKLCEELRGHAKECEAEDPELAMRFRHRAISINCCAEQLEWSLAHPSPAAPREDGYMPLEKDDAEQAIWQAIKNISIGNKTDDKLILSELRKLGCWIYKEHSA